MWEDIKAWFKAHGGLYHVIAGVWVFLVVAYPMVPAFHQLVIDIWAKTPEGARQVGLAIVGLAALYKTTLKGN